MDYIDRLIEEKDELSKRIGKLQEFILSEEFVTLCDTDKMLLDIQLQAMTTYLTILFARISREKGDNYD